MISAISQMTGQYESQLNNDAKILKFIKIIKQIICVTERDD